MEPWVTTFLTFLETSIPGEIVGQSIIFLMYRCNRWWANDILFSMTQFPGSKFYTVLCGVVPERCYRWTDNLHWGCPLVTITNLTIIFPSLHPTAIHKPLCTVPTGVWRWTTNSNEYNKNNETLHNMQNYRLDDGITLPCKGSVHVSAFSNCWCGKPMQQFTHTRKCPCWYPKWVGNVARSDEVVRVDLKEYWQSDGNRLKDCQTSCLYHHAYQHQWHSGIPPVQNVQLIFTKLPTAIVLDACLVWNPLFWVAC